MEFKYRAPQIRPGSTLEEDAEADTGSTLAGRVGAPVLLGGAGVQLNETSLLRQIDPGSVQPEVVMARELTKEQEKQYYFSMERYRLLSSRIFETARLSHTKVFLTASALAEEGKTLTTANLAFAMSKAGKKRTLLIEFDLRRPSLRALFQVPADHSEEHFLEAANWHDCLWSLRPNLHALLVPWSSDKPDTMMHSEATKQLIAQAREEYDYILIDSAPLLLAVDTHVLLPLIDHALLVVRADKTPISCCQEALRVLGSKGMGCILNDVKRMKYESYYKAYYG